MSDPQTTTPLFPIRRNRKHAVDPFHVEKLLQEMALEYPQRSGRHKLLTDAAQLIRKGAPDGN